MIMKQREFEKFLKAIGMQLGELREKKGFKTLKQFANQYGLPEIHYWRMENGKTNVTLKSLMKVLSIHNITLPDFFCLLQDQRKAA